MKQVKTFSFWNEIIEEKKKWNDTSQDNYVFEMKQLKRKTFFEMKQVKINNIEMTQVKIKSMIVFYSYNTYI